jgi:hypothetical protein
MSSSVPDQANEKEYDLAISFAGEDRDLARDITTQMTAHGYTFCTGFSHGLQDFCNGRVGSKAAEDGSDVNGRSVHTRRTCPPVAAMRPAAPRIQHRPPRRPAKAGSTSVTRCRPTNPAGNGCGRGSADRRSSGSSACLELKPVGCADSRRDSFYYAIRHQDSRCVHPQNN